MIPFTRDLLTIPVFIIILVTLVTAYVRYCYGYWQRRKVPYLEPKFPFGNSNSLFPKGISIGAISKTFYDRFKEMGHDIGVTLPSNLNMAEEQKELKAVFQGNCEFTKNLYAVLSRSLGNIFFCPISVHSILSLIYQGARGQTQEALSKALNVADERVAALGYKDVMTHFDTMTHVTLHIANKIFLQETYELQDTFKSVAEDQFLCEVDLLNLRSASAVAKSINTWVEEKTNKKIKDLFGPEDLIDDSALVLVNTVYFKGNWLEPFDVNDTRSETFYLNDSDTVNVPMMHKCSNFYYKDDEELGAQVLRLPYTNLHFNMIIILPKERNGIAKLEEKLANTDLTKITEKLSLLDVQVSLPKFKIELTTDLQGPLAQMGLGVIFTQDAELSGLIKSQRPLYVSKAVQKAFIEVNEEGSEAAAATGFDCRDCCFSYPEVFNADHPFVIILRVSHKSSTSVLFQGRISNP